MNMKLILNFLFLIIPQFLIAQDSFLKKYEGILITPRYAEFEIDGNQNYIVHPTGGNELKISILSEKGNFISGFDLLPDFPEFISNVGKHISAKDGNIAISFNTSLFTGMAVINPESKNFWSKKTSEGFGFLSRGIISGDGYVYSSFQSPRSSLFSEQPLSLLKLEVENGDLEWTNLYSNKNEKWASSMLFMENSIDNEPLVTFHTSLDDSLSQDVTLGSGIVSISKEGDVLNSSVIIGDSVYLSISPFTVDSDGNIFMAARIKTENIPNEKEGAIIKLNKNLELVWAKRLSAENFEYKGLNLKAFENGELIFAYYTEGDLPVITGKLDKDGKLSWHNGYSFFEPKIEVGNDSSIYFLSSKEYLTDGTSERALVISKTNSSGKIEGCDQFDACLTLHDFELNLVKWEWVKEDGPQFEPLSFQIDSFSNTLTDICGTPSPPSSYFVTPDTICQNECVLPDSINNNLAHAIKWTITGSDVLFEEEETFFRYCFNEPGKYQIEQEVWLLGCSEFFTREVVVLPDSLGDLLGDDQLICDDTVAVLKPSATRPLRDYLWSDSSRNSSLTISQSGIYGIEVSDGFCRVTDEVEITFFDEWLSGTDLELPTDTNICQELLPFTLTPKSDFSNEFYINGSTNPQSNFEIQTAGNYKISTKIEGCEITKNFNLSLVPCEVDIYIPSSFSPNNDGINDLLEPLGNDFIGKQMQVFDRWGGLLFETKEPPFAWDGSKVEQGVYVLTFSYLNLKNQREELISGDVLVVR